MTETPLKILIALQYYVPHRTGLTLHVQYVAEALAARGHQVTVLTARYDPDLPRDEQVINGVRVVRLWAPLRISRGMIMPAYLWAALRLVQLHDVVSIHTPMLETPILALFARIFRKGLVITHHGDLVLPKGLLNGFIESIILAMFRLAGRLAHRLIAYSHDYAEHSTYLAPFQDKVAAVYPPIRIPNADPQAVEFLRASWLEGVNGNARLIAYAGRFVEEKRPDVLIRALPYVHANFPGSRIVFAGQYDLKYEDFYERNLALIEQYREHLIFLGLLTDPQKLANFYASCDVLALPSDTECFALVQVEAMRNGTPVIVTNIPGAREVVRVTGMGEIVPPGNPSAMGAGIVKVLENRDVYCKPHQEIEASFSFEETIRQYEQHFREAALAARTQRAVPSQKMNPNS